MANLKNIKCWFKTCDNVAVVLDFNIPLCDLHNKELSPDKEETMKTVDITADNYKLEKFKKELELKGFTDYQIHTLSPLLNKCSIIQVKCEDNDIPTIHKVCLEVEGYFKGVRN